MNPLQSRQNLTTAMAICLGVVSAGAANAQSSVSISGAVDLGVRHVSNSAGSLTTVRNGNNTPSRLAFSGREDLGGGWSTSFWLETTVNADTGVGGTGATFWDRRSTLSLAGPGGELRLGRDYTPSFRAFRAADVIGFTGVAALPALFSAASSTPISQAFGTGASTITRSNNSIQYFSPKTWGPFYAEAMYGLKENNVADAFAFRGARLGYADGPWNVSVHASNTETLAKNDFKLMGLSAIWTEKGYKVAVGLTQMKHLDAKQTNLTVGAEVPVSAVGALRVSYRRADQSGHAASGASTDAADADFYSVSYIHSLSKRTALYGTVALVNNKGAGRYALTGGPAGAAPGTNMRGYEVGVRHFF